MTARNDVSRTDFVVNWPLPATGTTLLGSTATSAQLPGYTNIMGTFSVQDLLGLNNVSITFNTLAGSTAVGSLSIQGTDFGATSNDIFNPNIPWAPLNYPGTATPVAQAVATGSNSYNIQIPNTGVKWIRVLYTATSGTGTINAALTARANSRT